MSPSARSGHRSARALCRMSASENRPTRWRSTPMAPSCSSPESKQAARRASHRPAEPALEHYDRTWRPADVGGVPGMTPPRAKRGDPSLFAAARLERDAPRPLADRLRPTELGEARTYNPIRNQRPGGAPTRRRSTPAGRGRGQTQHWREHRATMVSSFAGCCPRAMSGHAAAAPPSSVINSRRPMKAVT